MRRLTALLRLRPVRLLVSVLVIVVAWQAFIASGVSGRVAPAVEEALAVEPRVTVVVRVSFDVEPFHLRFLQEQGIIAGTTERSVTLRRVDEEGVASMSRQYWIDRIDLATEDQAE